MKRRLFFTGPIGCGKSTAIATALGSRITQCCGFLTRRHREPQLHFTLESPDGRICETFLRFADGKPLPDPEGFSHAAIRLLEGEVLLLDEIGGIELLQPEFMSVLEGVLESTAPVIGVLKGEGPASALIEALGLTEEYAIAASRLRERLSHDTDTLLYECGQFDENALRLAEQWAEEYLHD